jgi:hypothetical protein
MKRARTEEAPQTGASASAASAASALPGVVSYTNKHRCLVFGSRGMTARYRHLLEDVRDLIPHHKKESKVRARGRAKRKGLRCSAPSRSPPPLLTPLPATPAPPPRAAPGSWTPQS